MTVKRILILAPLVLILFLLQSYLWVPTYEQQTRGSPERLHEYITPSIGDASLLNPILTADSASSHIESLVFEGLIDRDEDLRFRGRLAISWEVYEEAFFFVNEPSAVPGLGKAGAEKVADLIRKAKQKNGLSDPKLNRSLDLIKDISVIPPKEFVVTKSKKKPDGDKKETEVRIHVRTPARIKLTLTRVDQELFNNLTQLLGINYFASFRGEEHLAAIPQVEREELSEYARELLPATEHNPILIFYLRPNVQFHDGHVLDAYDVKFTYEAIMNPKNLSPRIPDYEPVKTVEVMDPLTVRIIYKQLYSPAIGTWAMGVLPEHLLNNEALKKEALRLGKDPEEFSMRQCIFNRSPIGSGPFVFKEWKSDQYIALERFEGYWEGPPNYKQYVYRVIPDLLTQEMEFYAGTLDNYGVRPHQVQRLKNDPKYQSFSGLSFGYTYIGYNLRRQPFKDRRVRLALGMAIDVDKIGLLQSRPLTIITLPKPSHLIMKEHESSLRKLAGVEMKRAGWKKTVRNYNSR
jgi:hypothetical protein